MRATAVILAGGGSLRMGRDKSLLKIGSRPMIGHIADQLAFFPERLVGANDPEKYAFLGLPVVPDEKPGVGPLMGLLSCVNRASHELCFVTGCDIPILDRPFILHLLAEADDHDIVVPRLPDGRVEPLLAVYRKTVVPVARDIVEHGGRRIVELFGHLRVRFVSGEALSWYSNINTIREYHQFIAGGSGGPKEDR
ncbi:MAG: molybdenum cofactor guanylyltransferase [Thermoanaerobaculaceae bacterium]|nr:molybdenum cofactor guanylyltransferase [Thermoanaerobaculaceae bacterium]